VLSFFVGGLTPVREAKSLRAQPNGKVLTTDGPYLETKEHIGGFWVLEGRWPGPGASVGAQGGGRLPGAGRSARVWNTTVSNYKVNDPVRKAL